MARKSKTTTPKSKGQALSPEDLDQIVGGATQAQYTTLKNSILGEINNTDITNAVAADAAAIASSPTHAAAAIADIESHAVADHVSQAAALAALDAATFGQGSSTGTDPVAAALTTMLTNNSSATEMATLIGNGANSAPLVAELGQAITVLAYGSSDGQHALGMQQTLALDKVNADLYAAATAVPNAAENAIAAQYYSGQISAYQANADEVQITAERTALQAYQAINPDPLLGQAVNGALADSSAASVIGDLTDIVALQQSPTNLTAEADLLSHLSSGSAEAGLEKLVADHALTSASADSILSQELTLVAAAAPNAVLTIGTGSIGVQALEFFAGPTIAAELVMGAATDATTQHLLTDVANAAAVLHYGAGDTAAVTGLQAGLAGELETGLTKLVADGVLASSDATSFLSQVLTTSAMEAPNALVTVGTGSVSLEALESYAGTALAEKIMMGVGTDPTTAGVLNDIANAAALQGTPTNAAAAAALEARLAGGAETDLAKLVSDGAIASTDEAGLLSNELATLATAPNATLTIGSNTVGAHALETYLGASLAEKVIAGAVGDPTTAGLLSDIANAAALQQTPANSAAALALAARLGGSTETDLLKLVSEGAIASSDELSIIKEAVATLATASPSTLINIGGNSISAQAFNAFLTNSATAPIAVGVVTDPTTIGLIAALGSTTGFATGLASGEVERDLAKLVSDGTITAAQANTLLSNQMVALAQTSSDRSTVLGMPETLALRQAEVTLAADAAAQALVDTAAGHTAAVTSDNALVNSVTALSSAEAGVIADLGGIAAPANSAAAQALTARLTSGVAETDLVKLFVAGEITAAQLSTILTNELSASPANAAALTTRLLNGTGEADLALLVSNGTINGQQAINYLQTEINALAATSPDQQTALGMPSGLAFDLALTKLNSAANTQWWADGSDANAASINGYTPGSAAALRVAADEAGQTRSMALETLLNNSYSAQQGLGNSGTITDLMNAAALELNPGNSAAAQALSARPLGGAENDLATAVSQGAISGQQAVNTLTREINDLAAASGQAGTALGIAKGLALDLAEAKLDVDALTQEAAATMAANTAQTGLSNASQETVSQYNQYVAQWNTDVAEINRLSGLDTLIQALPNNALAIGQILNAYSTDTKFFTTAEQLGQGTITGATAVQQVESYAVADGLSKDGALTAVELISGGNAAVETEIVSRLLSGAAEQDLTNLLAANPAAPAGASYLQPVTQELNIALQALSAVAGTSAEAASGLTQQQLTDLVDAKLYKDAGALGVFDTSQVNNNLYASLYDQDTVGFDAVVLQRTLYVTGNLPLGDLLDAAGGTGNASTSSAIFSGIVAEANQLAQGTMTGAAAIAYVEGLAGGAATSKDAALVLIDQLSGGNAAVEQELTNRVLDGQTATDLAALNQAGTINAPEAAQLAASVIGDLAQHSAHGTALNLDQGTALDLLNAQLTGHDSAAATYMFYNGTTIGSVGSTLAQTYALLGSAAQVGTFLAIGDALAQGTITPSAAITQIEALAVVDGVSKDAALALLLETTTNSTAQQPIVAEMSQRLEDGTAANDLATLITQHKLTAGQAGTILGGAVDILVKNSASSTALGMDITTANQYVQADLVRATGTLLSSLGTTTTVPNAGQVIDALYQEIGNTAQRDALLAEVAQLTAGTLTAAQLIHNIEAGPAAAIDASLALIALNSGASPTAQQAVATELTNRLSNGTTINLLMQLESAGTIGVGQTLETLRGVIVALGEIAPGGQITFTMTDVDSLTGSTAVFNNGDPTYMTAAPVVYVAGSTDNAAVTVTTQHQLTLSAQAATDWFEARLDLAVTNQLTKVAAGTAAAVHLTALETQLEGSSTQTTVDQYQQDVLAGLSIDTTYQTNAAEMDAAAVIAAGTHTISDYGVNVTIAGAAWATAESAAITQNVANYVTTVENSKAETISNNYAQYVFNSMTPAQQQQLAAGNATMMALYMQEVGTGTQAYESGLSYLEANNANALHLSQVISSPGSMAGYEGFGEEALALKVLGASPVSFLEAQAVDFAAIGFTLLLEQNAVAHALGPVATGILKDALSVIVDGFDALSAITSSAAAGVVTSSLHLAENLVSVASDLDNGNWSSFVTDATKMGNQLGSDLEGALKNLGSACLNALNEAVNGIADMAEGIASLPGFNAVADALDEAFDWL